MCSASPELQNIFLYRVARSEVRSVTSPCLRPDAGAAQTAQTEPGVAKKCCGRRQRVERAEQTVWAGSVTPGLAGAEGSLQAAADTARG